MHCPQQQPESIEIRIEPHAGIRGRCSRCQRPAPGYDRLPQRRWLCVPLWGIPTYFCYAPRRVECAAHGVVVEHIPWSDGKRPVTCAMMGFLARWARRLSWRETARVARAVNAEALSPHAEPKRIFGLSDRIVLRPVLGKRDRWAKSAACDEQRGAKSISAGHPATPRPAPQSARSNLCKGRKDERPVSAYPCSGQVRQTADRVLQTIGLRRTQ